MRERGKNPSKLSTRPYSCINLDMRWVYSRMTKSSRSSLSRMFEEARICPGGGHVVRVMRHRGQTDSQMATLPVSDADISIQPPAIPRPLLPSMVTKYLDGGFLGSGPLTQY